MIIVSGLFSLSANYEESYNFLDCFGVEFQLTFCISVG